MSKREHQGTGRKDTGRTDEFSDETPKKDFSDFREKHPQSEDVIPRQQSRDGSDKTKRRLVGRVTLLVATQYLTSVTQNFRENFGPQDQARWDRQYNAAVKLVEIARSGGAKTSDELALVEKLVLQLK